MDNSRTQILIGKENIKLLEQKHVIVVGVGGVGGWVAYMLARAGICKLTLVDFDIVSSSNINRQILANVKTIGKIKVEVLKQILLEINPQLNIRIFNEQLTETNVAKLITSCDMCIDAIDSVNDKVSLIKHCKQNDIPIISAMGAGNRYDIPHFEVMDIFKTHDDGLAKVMRKKLRQEGVENLEVVCAGSKALSVGGGTVGSISYYPAMCGITLAAVVINKFLKGEGK